jgi:hypothetical protein
MTHPDKPSTRGFGPIALIVTGVVCFAAGYMVNDLTKALGGGVPEHKPGSAVKAPEARDPDPAPEQPAADSQVPVSAPDEPAKAPEKKDQEKPAPVGGAGAPPPKG